MEGLSRQENEGRKTYALCNFWIFGETLNLLDVFIGQCFERDLIVSRGDVIRFDDRRKDWQIVLNVQRDIIGISIDTENFLETERDYLREEE